MQESPCDSFVDVLRSHARARPDALAYVFVGDTESELARWTFADVDARARAIAVEILARSECGDRALLLYASGIEFIAAFFGCLYAGVVAVPAYPPRRGRSLERFESIARNAGASLCLTTTVARAQMGEVARDGTGVQWLCTDAVEVCRGEHWLPRKLTPSSLAFLQYTSGSTGDPKGVMVTHGNLLANEESIRRGFAHDDRTMLVGWLPLFHDMGLIGNVLNPLYLGTPSVLMSPTTFLQKPVRWLAAISKYRATTSGGPNFAYDLCAARVTEEQKRGLDLSSWNLAFNGAEPIRAETLDTFARAFEGCGFRREAFYPCFGMAEATLFVTGTRKGAPRTLQVDAASLKAGIARVSESAHGDTTQLVSSGRSWHEDTIRVVDPETFAPLRDGLVGELWVQGPSVAAGYFRDPERTAASFDARTCDGQGPFLRTGDLGFLQDGELYVTGRIKDVVIIRGANHYPQDLELSASRSHPCLMASAGAAFAIHAEGQERVVIVHEAELQHEASTSGVRSAVRAALAREHGLEVHEIVLIKPRTIPKTSSGKIRRSACRELYLSRGLQVLESAPI